MIDLLWDVWVEFTSCLAQVKRLQDTVAALENEKKAVLAQMSALSSITLDTTEIEYADVLTAQAGLVAATASDNAETIRRAQSDLDRQRREYADTRAAARSRNDPAPPKKALEEAQLVLRQQGEQTKRRGDQVVTTLLLLLLMAYKIESIHDKAATVRLLGMQIQAASPRRANLSEVVNADTSTDQPVGAHEQGCDDGSAAQQQSSAAPAVDAHEQGADDGSAAQRQSSAAPPSNQDHLEESNLSSDQSISDALCSLGMKDIFVSNEHSVDVVHALHNSTAKGAIVQGETAAKLLGHAEAMLIELRAQLLKSTASVEGLSAPSTARDDVLDTSGGCQPPPVPTLDFPRLIRWWHQRARAQDVNIS